MQVQDVMQRNVTTVAEDETLGLAIQLMLWNDIRHLPVIRPADARVVGVISERDVLRARQAGEQEEVLARPVRDFMHAPAEHIHPKAAVADAAADLSAMRLGCLPVMDAGQLVGIVTVSDVLATVAQYPASRRGRGEDPADSVTAQAMMRSDLITARADDELFAATAKMLAAGIRHLCVVDGDERLVGVVSDRDVRSAIGDPRRALSSDPPPASLRRLTVGDVMTPDPRAVSPQAIGSEVLQTLITERFGALPVVDEDERLVGIISYLDVLRFLGQRLMAGASERDRRIA